MALDVQTVIARRSDLASFVVHLTRDTDAPKNGALDNLRSIVTTRRIDARTPMGLAVSKLKPGGGLDSQNVVCFTETPLDMIKHMAIEVEGRDRQFKSCGIAIPRATARRANVNPVWYIDVTAPAGGYRAYLTPHVTQLVEDAIKSGVPFEKTAIAQLAPFFESMGTNKWVRKEFWWEREWRHRGHFTVPNRYLGLCPEENINEFQKLALAHGGVDCRFIDPMWPGDKILGTLAGFSTDELDVL